MAGRPSREQLYRRLDEAAVELRERLGGLPTPLRRRDIWTAIWYQEAHHSTAIEGNTLVLRQVEILRREGRAVGSKELKEYLEVKGYADAARWVYSHALQPGGWSGSLLTLTEVRHVHQMALGPAWDVAPHPLATAKEGPGSFREHDIQPFPGGMTPATWTEVLRRRIRDWVWKPRAPSPTPSDPSRPWPGPQRLRTHPPVPRWQRSCRPAPPQPRSWSGSAIAPAIIYTRDRTRYLRPSVSRPAAIQARSRRLLARGVLDNLYRFIVPAVAGPNRLVPLAALATPNMTEGALRSRPTAAGSEPRKAPTASGGAPKPGLRTTKQGATSATPDVRQPVRGVLVDQSVSAGQSTCGGHLQYC